MNKIMIEEEDKLIQWSKHKLFSNINEWDTLYQEIYEQVINLTDFHSYIGAEVCIFKKALDQIYALSQKIEKLAVYAQMSFSENLANVNAQEMIDKITHLDKEFSMRLSYFEPALVSLDDAIIQVYLKSPELEIYKRSLYHYIRFKPYVLSDKEEKLLSLYRGLNHHISEVFEMLSNADLQLAEIDTEEGKQRLTSANFINFLENPQQNIRQQAYYHYYDYFERRKHTLSSIFKLHILKDTHDIQARGYNSCFEASLLADEIPKQVCDNLLEVVHQSLPLVHEFYSFKKENLNLKTFYRYDIYAPMTKDIDLELTYSDCVDILIESVSPLGEKYQNIVRQGLKQDNWVDPWERPAKRSGAFCISCYDSPHPYILMNFNSKGLHSLFTLTHEVGHAMHSLYTTQNNAYPSYDYTIFEAEIASTVHEQLLTDYLLKYFHCPKKKMYLLEKSIDRCLATIWRQSMFFEYELIIHNYAESNQVLTLDLLRQEYRQLMHKYFGSDVQLLDYSDLESLLIPHFYHSFYVYKYSTGLLSAIYLSQNLLNKTLSYQNYIQFLSTGGSLSPIDALKIAQCDVLDIKIFKQSIQYFSQCLSDLKKEYRFS